MSILTGECAILDAAILWKALTRPRTLRAFLEARFPVDASFRELLRGLSVSGEGARDSPVAVSRSLPLGVPELTVSVSALDFGKVICSEDRSGQPWPLLGGRCAARFPRSCGHEWAFGVVRPLDPRWARRLTPSVRRRIAQEPVGQRSCTAIRAAKSLGILRLANKRAVGLGQQSGVAIKKIRYGTADYQDVRMRKEKESSM